MIPIERWGQADELAKVMLFLSSSVSSVPVGSIVVNRPKHSVTAVYARFSGLLLENAPGAGSFGMGTTAVAMHTIRTHTERNACMFRVLTRCY